MRAISLLFWYFKLLSTKIYSREHYIGATLLQRSVQGARLLLEIRAASNYTCEIIRNIKSKRKNQQTESRLAN
jgi:hypothetical protein